MTSFKEEEFGKLRAWQTDLPFCVFIGEHAKQEEVDFNTVQQTGVLLSSTTSDQIRRIPKRLMLLEVRVATKSLVHIYPYICLHTYIYTHANIPEFGDISQNLQIPM